MARVVWSADIGAGFAVIGVAICASRSVAPWLGWAGIAVGLAGTATGLVLLIKGATVTSINWMLRQSAAASTLYLVVLGIALERDAPSPALEHV